MLIVIGPTLGVEGGNAECTDDTERGELDDGTDWDGGWLCVGGP